MSISEVLSSKGVVTALVISDLLVDKFVFRANTGYSVMTIIRLLLKVIALVMLRK